MKLNAKRTLLPLLAVALLIGAGIFAHLALASGGEKAAAPSKAYAAATYAPVEDATATEIPFVDAPNIFYGVPTGDFNSTFCDYRISLKAERLLFDNLLKTRDDRFVDYYGGGFSAYDRDIFYVYITDLTKVPALNRALGEYAEGVVFLPAKYSYNYLADLAMSTHDELVAAGIRATGYGPDVNYGKQQILMGVLPEDLEAAREYINNNYPNPEIFDIVGMSYVIPNSAPSDASEAEAIRLNTTGENSDSAALKAAELLRMVAVYTL